MPEKKHLYHLATRILNVPLMVTADKLNVILHVLGPRIGLEISQKEAVADFSKPMRYREDSGDGIGLIPVYDSLVYRASGLDALSGLTTYDQIRSQFQEAIADPSIGSILFDMDSPGGEVAGVFDLVDDIYNARGTKPIYAIANENAYSAAYAIASAADKIFVPRTGGVGSIGVIAVHVDQSGWDEKAGLKYTPIFAGARKNDFSPHEPLADDAKAVGQTQVNEVYDLFVETVARNRDMKVSAVRATQAGIYQGANAVKEGLADAVMNYGEVIRTILKESKGEVKMDKESKAQGATAAESQTPETTVAESKALKAPPVQEANIDLDRVQKEARAQAILDERARVKEIREACAAVNHLISADLPDKLIESGVTVEKAREQIINAIADNSCQKEVRSTVGATSTGEVNPLVADAKRRAGKEA